jgi:hypothetical protein
MKVSSFLMGFHILKSRHLRKSIKSKAGLFFCSSSTFLQVKKNINILTINPYYSPVPRKSQLLLFILLLRLALGGVGNSGCATGTENNPDQR